MIGGHVSPSDEERPKLPTKILLNVTIQGSLGAVQLFMKPESTVADLIAAVVNQYVKEGRRPVLLTTDPSGFDLHYSQFTLESQDREEELVLLGSRNFFLCRRSAATDLTAYAANTSATTSVSSSSSSCKKEAEKAAMNGFGLPWLKFIGFLQ